jgi:tetratricopeptide (TPR) repeat protein
MANEIHKIREAVEAQLMKVDKVIASNEAIAEELTNIEAELAHGFSEISKGIQDLCCITYHGFHEIIDRLHFQSEMLEEIKEILKRPLDTQAKELRERGERAYLNNWFNEAEQDLLEAEKKNYQDFIVHQILGNIYYFHKSNYKKALEYYQKAAKYATPVSKRDASNAFLCAAMVYYRLNQLSDAYNSAKAALELMPDDPHFLYQYARYAAKNGYMNEFLNKLRECIYKDPKYLIMADVDEMFYDVKEEITKLAKYLRDEKKAGGRESIQRDSFSRGRSKNYRNQGTSSIFERTTNRDYQIICSQ